METSHRMVETNGIKMHIAEQGEGPLVIMCHGFPEFWYSWRHQLPALAKAGFHAVAPDQRGYGQTDRPEPIEAYNILQLVGDIVGLVHALGEERAVIVGHDWGAPVAWNCALLRPDIFHKLILLSVPYSLRSWTHIRPIEGMKRMAGDHQFYIVYFQEPGKIEKEMEENVRETMLKTLYSLSGDPPPEKRWKFLFGKDQKFTDTSYMPDVLPAWLTEHDVDVFTEEFSRTGFRGGVNWYRNLDRNWELTPFLSEAKIYQPSLFIAGELDGVITFSRTAFDNLESAVPNLKQKILIPGAGHWVQQESPQQVNDLLIDFLKDKD
ncbi:MAG: alpha/beta hydrolase [Deltaproteobacteria bacterium]|nr:alpha/beta hydrolase [Deltaproteobacteria bacterium]MBW2141817.1 alpha/beta hydrolase [Deltaproteobacteria bacterium]MBW2323683.1 alpha/beta hydrolase [Deltaproteobacteria bacterium]